MSYWCSWILKQLKRACIDFAIIVSCFHVIQNKVASLWLDISSFHRVMGTGRDQDLSTVASNCQEKSDTGSVLDLIAAFRHCQIAMKWVIGDSGELLVSQRS